MGCDAMVGSTIVLIRVIPQLSSKSPFKRPDFWLTFLQCLKPA